MWKWKHFTEKEIVNPTFDDCPANSWAELKPAIQERLSHTLDLLEAIREHVNKAIRVNSTYRPKSRGSAHAEGKAIDFQLIDSEDEEYLSIMDWLKEEYSGTGFRAFLEWNGLKPWIHIDRGFKDRGGKQFFVSYPTGGKRNATMNYKTYEGKLPQSYI